MTLTHARAHALARAHELIRACAPPHSLVWLPPASVDEVDTVSRHIPEFGRYGKELITIEHLLVHTAGIPYADVSMWSSMHEWDKVLEAIYESKIEDGWQPGRKAAYHPYSSWFLLGEIVRRLDGRHFQQ